jgi:hypothetical protein
VRGCNAGSGPGVHGESGFGPGVFAKSLNGVGMRGETVSTSRVAAIAGVNLGRGEGPGLHGESRYGPGVFAVGYPAGHFEGDVVVTGSLRNPQLSHAIESLRAVLAVLEVVAAGNPAAGNALANARTLINSL